MCKKPCRQPFHVEPTELNFKACRQPFHVEPTELNFKAFLTEGYSEVSRTKMLNYALSYVARIHCSDNELRALEDPSAAFTFGPSTPPVTPG
jgi:hypothetical protein